ncbi:MAG TPA: PAS domain S-box protein, partial [Bacteroidales bacterium]
MKENILLFFKYLVFSLGYLILANVGHFSSVKPHEFVPFWLPGGLYVAILFLTKAKHWPLVVVAAVISNISFDLIDGKPFWLTSIFSLANSVDAVIGVWLFRKIKPSVPTFESPREVFLFLGFNVILSPGFSTTVCSGIISLKEGLPFWSIWITWWSGAAVGVILIAPLILILWQAIIKKNFLFTFFKKVEFITMLGVTIIISWLILSGIGNWMLSQKYLILFIFIWAIIRFGQVGVVCTNIIVAYTVVFCQTRYSSVLIWHSQLSPYQENTASQIFIFSMSFSSLLISSIISERNRSIKNLSLSESKFSSLINNASDVIFIHSLDGYLLEVNDEACRRLEYSKEELLKMRMRDIISPRFTEGVKSRIKNIVSKGHMFIEIEHMSKSGKIIPTEINATLIDYGKNKAILGIGRDLTDRLIAEKKLKENEERYRLVIKASNDGIWDWDIESDYVYYSPRWKQMIGYENHELENTLDTWIRTIHPDDLATARQLLKEHFEENKPYDFIARFFHKNGSLRWIQVKGFALRDENGKPFRMIGNHTDITDKKLAEDELRESQLRFRVAFLTSPDAININRLSDGMYIDINEGFTRLSGWTKDEIIGRTSLEINIWGSGEDRIKLVRALKKDGICDNLEAQFRGKDGSLRTCLMSAQLIDLHGEHCILSITRDITDLKITKRQILEKN